MDDESPGGLHVIDRSSIGSDMAVLSKGEFRKRLKLRVRHSRSLVITPIFDSDVFDADSVDLRLGTHFLLPRTTQQTYLCPYSKSSNAFHTSVYVPLGKYLVVPAHQTVLGSTLEFIKLPYNLCGQILTKSSVARTFIVIETAPWIHPEYRGCLTLEIANVSNTPVLLYPGRAIAQLVLLRVLKAKPRRKLESTYFGPIYPEAPKFRDPKEDLKEIGISKVWVIEGPKPI